VGDEARAEGEVPLLELARGLGLTERLRERHIEVLPVIGPGACFTDPQGREPVSPESVADLISSIGAYGVLQPGLAERLPGGEMRLVAGGRRLAACRWGAVNRANNEHYRTFPVWVCPGPLSEEERRAWQLIENLAREDLRPGELAAALLYERCAMLVTRLLHAGVAVPRQVVEIEDPVARWRELERLRGTNTEAAAPWSLVLRRLGLQLSARKAQSLVRAFAEMPPELAWDMDANGIALSTRLEWLRLSNGRREAADAIWEAVKASGHPELLGAAVKSSVDHPGLDPDDAVERAAELHAQANESRATRLRAGGADNGGGPGVGVGADTGGVEDLVDPEMASAAIDAMRSLLLSLRGGARLDRYQTGSLVLFGRELLELLDPPARVAIAV
jgi:ParB family chromosome partitioning protein